MMQPVTASTTTAEAHQSVFAPTIPGLPSGYSGLPRELVEASQRQRLVHGVTVAVADKGYGLATVADIVARAGVSKKTFYQYFADKLACFLAAHEVGSQAMLEASTSASRDALSAGLDPIEQLRCADRAYLAFLVAEEPYARMFFLETLAAGPEAIKAFWRCRDAFVASLRIWHDQARETHPAWPAATPLAYEAALGAIHDLALARIATGRTAELTLLEDEFLAIQLAVLRVPES
jgi:AcrR family transcriptional regulator